MKKSMIFFLVIAMLLAACSGKSGNSSENGESSTPKDPVNITFTIFDDGVGVDKKLVDEWNATHPDIQVTYKPLPASELKDRLTTWLAAADDSLDVIGVDVVWPSGFAKAGWIRALEDLMDDEMKSSLTNGTFMKGPADIVTVEGKVYALPWNSTAGMLYYRKDLLEAEGLSVPKTWDELIAVSGQLGKKNNVNGFVGQYKQYEGLVCNVLEIMESYNGHFLDENGKVVVNSPENLTAVNTMLKLKSIMPEGVSGYQEKEAQETFMSGGAVFLRTWNSFWASIDKDDSPLKGKVGVTTLPAGADGKMASALGGWNLAISSFSKHPQESYEFIKWMTDAKQQKVKALEGGRLPTIASLYEDQEIITVNPTIKNFFEILSYGVSRPKTAEYGKVSEVIQEEMSLAFHNQKSPEQALSDLQKKLEDATK